MVRKSTIALTAAGAAIMAGLSAITSVAGAAETVNYSYDAKGRLVKVEHSGTINNGVVANYTLDRADNRRQVKVTGAP